MESIGGESIVGRDGDDSTEVGAEVRVDDVSPKVTEAVEIDSTTRWALVDARHATQESRWPNDLIALEKQQLEALVNLIDSLGLSVQEALEEKSALEEQNQQLAGELESYAPLREMIHSQWVREFSDDPENDGTTAEDYDPREQLRVIIDSSTKGAAEAEDLRRRLDEILHPGETTSITMSELLDDLEQRSDDDRDNTAKLVQVIHELTGVLTVIGGNRYLVRELSDAARELSNMADNI